MGRRRKEPLLSVLINLPWWMGLSAAILILVARYAWLTWATARMPRFVGMYQGFSIAFYGIALLFALGALGSFIRQRMNGGLLKRQIEQGSFSSLSWREFERLLQEAFRRKGYFSVDTPRGPDGGYDLVLRKDGKRYLVQAKHWQSRQVGVKVVRELWGVVSAEGADGGIIVNSGAFTDDAYAFAAKLPLDLIDGPALRHILRMVTGESLPGAGDARQIASTATPGCPRCGRPMRRRRARRGKYLGQEFWGCSAYPACRGVVSIESGA